MVQWLADHRTTGGSYPEKVLETGDPAAVAPLAWTAAATLLAIEKLPADAAK
jgi:GH15 family glucan-1,4-alpha-glucosidase